MGEIIFTPPTSNVFVATKAPAEYRPGEQPYSPSPQELVYSPNEQPYSPSPQELVYSPNEQPYSPIPDQIFTADPDLPPLDIAATASPNADSSPNKPNINYGNGDDSGSWT